MSVDGNHWSKNRFDSIRLLPSSWFIIFNLLFESCRLFSNSSAICFVFIPILVVKLCAAISETFATSAQAQFCFWEFFSTSFTTTKFIHFLRFFFFRLHTVTEISCFTVHSAICHQSNIIATVPAHVDVVSKFLFYSTGEGLLARRTLEFWWRIGIN